MAANTPAVLSDPFAEGLQSLAIAHEVNTEYLQEEFDRIREALGGKLGGMALDEVAEGQKAVAMRNFIGQCVDLLPHPADSTEFRTESQAELRWLQASVVWIPGYPKRATPFYVIGQADQGRRTEMLLHETSPWPVDTSEDLLVVEMTRRRHQKHRVPFLKKLSGPSALSPDEMNRLFDRESERYVLEGDAKDSPDIVKILGMDGSVIGQLEKLLMTKTDTLPVKIKERLAAAVYNPTLTRLNVANHLSYLALAFGKTDELGRLIDRYAPDYGETAPSQTES